MTVVQLPPGQSYSVIGKRVPRPDAPDKARGATPYVADIRRSGLLHGAVLRSPYPHARIKRMDTSAAAKLPGVKALVTAEDTPRHGWGAFRKDQPILATGKVRYVGEEVAAVAAVDSDTAREAIGLIEVEWEELPAVLSIDEAMSEGAPLVHDNASGNITYHFNLERGDVDAGFARSQVVVENTWQSARQYHSAIETIGSVAEWDTHGRVTIWVNTQTPFLSRGRYAYALDLPERDVRVIQTEVGGGFGGKSGDDNNPLVCAVLARKAGRPVQLVNTREEEFLAGSRPRIPMRYTVRLGFSRDGRVQAKDIKIVADNGAYTGKSIAVLGAATVRHDALYRYPAVRADSTLVYTNLIPTGAFRGFGNPSADWAVEQAWDMAAEALGMDVVDLLLLNAVQPGDVSPHNHRVTSCELKACIQKAADLIDWRNKKGAHPPAPSPERGGGDDSREGFPLSGSPGGSASQERPSAFGAPRAAQSPTVAGTADADGPTGQRAAQSRAAPLAAEDAGGPKLRGLGMACSVHVSGRRSFGDYDGSSAVVRVNEDGRATIITGEGEIGQGASTVLRQIAAEELGLPFQDVEVTRADTELTTHALGALASRVTYVAGNAVRRASTAAREQLLQAAASQLETSAEDLEVRDGKVHIKGAPSALNGGLPVGDVARKRLYQPGGGPIIGVGEWDNPSEFPDESRYGNESGAYNFIAEAAEVEVDPDTGEVKVLELVAAVDCGTVLNPTLAEGQVEGGVAQGYGLAVTENFAWSDGRPQNPNFGDYKLPTVGDMPRLKVAFVESYEPSGPFGAKGVGEIGLDAVPAAIANAIYAACRVRISELPITAEKVFAGLRAQP